MNLWWSLEVLGFTCGILLLLVPGKVVRLEFISQLFAALLLLLPTLFTLLPVGPCRNVQDGLAGQNLPADRRRVNEEPQEYFTFSKSLVLRSTREEEEKQVTKTFQTSADVS